MVAHDDAFFVWRRLGRRAKRIGDRHRRPQTGVEVRLPEKAKQLIAVAVAHVTQCPNYIKGQPKAALRHGATREELMEDIGVAVEMRAGGAYAHATISLTAMDEVESPRSS